MELWGSIDSIFGIGTKSRWVEFCGICVMDSWRKPEVYRWYIPKLTRLTAPPWTSVIGSCSPVILSLFVSKELFQIQNGAAHNQCLPFPWKIGILIDLFLPNTLNDSNLARVQACLVGRFKYVFNVHPDAWGNDPVLTIVLFLSIFQECGEQPEVLLCVWCPT